MHAQQSFRRWPYAEVVPLAIRDDGLVTCGTDKARSPGDHRRAELDGGVERPGPEFPSDPWFNSRALFARRHIRDQEVRAIQTRCFGDRGWSHQVRLLYASLASPLSAAFPSFS